MRSFIAAIPMSLLLVTPFAGAQSHDYPLTTGSDIATVHVRPAMHRYPVTEQETEAVKGDYALTNGWHLRVRSTYKGIEAQVDQQPPMYLRALSGDKYITDDGNVDMTFNLGAMGDDMLMSYVPQSQVAARLTVGTSEQLAAR